MVFVDISFEFTMIEQLLPISGTFGGGLNVFHAVSN